MGEVASDFAPLVLVALFIERALEVFLTPWRAGEADRLETEFKRAEAKAKEPRASSEAQAEAIEGEQKLVGYRSETRRIAFATGIVAGVVISAIGVRGLEIFVDAVVFDGLAAFQRNAFRVSDVVLTGALLGGGADGIHKIVAVFTGFLEKTVQQQRARARQQS